MKPQAIVLNPASVWRGPVGRVLARVEVRSDWQGQQDDDGHLADRIEGGRISAANRKTEAEAKAKPKPKRPRKTWARAEDRFLELNYGPMTATQIGLALGRSAHSVYARVMVIMPHRVKHGR